MERRRGTRYVVTRQHLEVFWQHGMAEIEIHCNRSGFDQRVVIQPNKRGPVVGLTRCASEKDQGKHD